MKHLADLRVLILGLGDSGLAMARWCARHGAAELRVWDSREAPPQLAALQAELPQAEFFSGPLSAASLGGAQLVLKSPGLSPLDERLAPLLQAAQRASVVVAGELDLFAQALADMKAACGYAPKVIAITGTNGKTTTTSLTGKLVERCGRRVAVAGNIGPSLLDTVSAALDAEDVAQAALAAQAQSDAAAAEPAKAPACIAAHDTQPVPLEEIDTLRAPWVENPEPLEEGAPVFSPASPSLSPADAVCTVPAAWIELPVSPESSDSPLELADALLAEPANAPQAESANAPLAESANAPLVVRAAPEPVFAQLPQVWVLELSSFQLDGVRGFEPSAGTVLNVTQDHLDWHGNMAAYAQAKARVFGQQGLMVINRDDAQVEAMVPAPIQVQGGRGKPKRLVGRAVCRFGLDAPRHPGDFGLVTENGMAWLVRAMPADETFKPKTRPGVFEAEEIVLQRLMPADALRIRGRHNAANALAALALATGIGCPLAPMLHGLREYRGEPHRVELIGQVGGVEAFDDSKGTNVGATVAALNGLGADRLSSRLVVILGGDGKGQDFAPLAEPLARHARAVATLGRDAQAIELAIEPGLAPAGVPVQRHATLEAAVAWCFEQAQPGDAVLLSPACASLDMFRNYAHRAEVFVSAVQALALERGEMLS